MEIALTSKSLYCLIREEWVAALPEEYVRQRVLNHMVNDCGFPKSLLAVEKPLRQLSHLSAAEQTLVPDRRADIICFAKDERITNGGIFPLLLVECKAVKLTSRVVDQVVGYNHFIRARYVMIVNQTELQMGWYDVEKKEYVFIDYLPNYKELREEKS